MTYVVRVRRGASNWWVIEVPSVPGVITQARRIDQVEEMARDALGLFLDVDPAGLEVQVDLELPEAWARVVDDARQARVASEKADRAAADAVRRAARELTSAGLSMRDVGSIMGVSHQRVAQLVAGGEAR